MAYGLGFMVTGLWYLFSGAGFWYLVDGFSGSCFSVFVLVSGLCSQVFGLWLRGYVFWFMLSGL